MSTISHHTHKCQNCGGLWIHADDNSGKPGAHDCPHCGGLTVGHVVPARGINYSQPQAAAVASPWIGTLGLFLICLGAGLLAAAFTVLFMEGKQ